MFLYLLMLIQDVFVMLDCFKYYFGPLYSLPRTKFYFGYLYYIYKQFYVPLSRQIALSLTLGHFIIYFVPDFALNAYIVFMNRIYIRYFVEVEYYNEQGKILIVKSIDNMSIHLLCTIFCLLIQNFQVSSTFHL